MLHRIRISLSKIRHRSTNYGIRDVFLECVASTKIQTVDKLNVYCIYAILNLARVVCTTISTVSKTNNCIQRIIDVILNRLKFCSI